MEEKHKTTLNPNNGDFHEIALHFIEILYQSAIHKACYLNFYWQSSGLYRVGRAFESGSWKITWLLLKVIKTKVLILTTEN